VCLTEPASVSLVQVSLVQVSLVQPMGAGCNQEAITRGARRPVEAEGEPVGGRFLAVWLETCGRAARKS
jgi:hypothetical protein